MLVSRKVAARWLAVSLLLPLSALRAQDTKDEVAKLEAFNVTTPIENSTITQRLRNTFNRRRYAYYDWNIYGDIGPNIFKQTLLFGVDRLGRRPRRFDPRRTRLRRGQRLTAS